MTEEQIMSLIQAYADEKAQAFVFKRSSKLDHIYEEVKEDGTIQVLTLGSDMPKLIYRVFEVKPDETVTEIDDIQKVVEISRHYNIEVKPTLKLVPPAVEETGEYNILVENRLPNNAVEIKLTSSVGRNLTMIETYRYFDYVSRIFFVSCLALSFGGQYLFSVAPGGKQLRLIVGNDEAIRSRVNMINELLQAKVLPSYQTIDAGNKALSNDPNARGRVTLGEDVYLSNFCYDDLESGNLFAFFVKENDPQNGLVFIQDIVTSKLTLSNVWTEEQKAAADKVLKLLSENQEEFNKHAHSFFADSLDLRYRALKEGKLSAEILAQASETQAEQPVNESAVASEEKPE